jgi:hypothetical protein
MPPIHSHRIMILILFLFLTVNCYSQDISVYTTGYTLAQSIRLRCSGWYFEIAVGDSLRPTKTQPGNFPVVIDLQNKRIKIYSTFTWDIYLLDKIVESHDTDEVRTNYNALDKSGTECKVFLETPYKVGKFTFDNGDQIAGLSLLIILYKKIKYVFALDEDN